MNQEHAADTIATETWRTLAVGEIEDKHAVYNSLIRRELLELFQSMPPEIRKEYDRMISDHIFRNLPRKAAVVAYIASDSDGEPSVTNLIHSIHEQMDMTVCLPRYCTEAKGSVAFDRIHPGFEDHLTKNKLGVLEMEQELHDPVSLKSLSHIIVPTLISSMHLGLARNDGYQQLARSLKPENPDLRFWAAAYFWSPVMQTDKQYPLDAIVRPDGFNHDQRK